VDEIRPFGRRGAGYRGVHMSDYDHRDLDDEPEEDDLHSALDSDEEDEPQPWAKTSSGDADEI
jgi:hypothetical protein